MTTAVQHRRGTTAEHSTFTGLEGEVTIDTTKDTAVIHDGVLAGGYPLAKENLANVTTSGLSSIDGASTASDDKFFIYDQSATTLKTITRAELNNAMEQDALANVAITGGTINGTAIGGTTAAAGAFTTLSASGAVTLSGGTANSIPYLNSSKVLTSGSALTFDGTNFALTCPGSIAYGSFGTSTNSTNIGADGTGSFIGTQSGGTNIRYNINGSEQMRLTSTGLGIGTSSPTAKLDVAGAVRSTLGTGGIAFSGDPTPDFGFVGYNYTNVSGTEAVTVSGRESWRHRFGNGSVKTWSVGYRAANAAASSWTEYLTLDSSGNLGVGTSSPDNGKLTVVKNTTTATESTYGIAIQSVATNGYTELLLGADDATNCGVIQTAAKNSSFTSKNLVLQPNGGNLGLGVTPSAWSGYGPVFQMKNGGGLANNTGEDVHVFNNCYYNGSSWRYITSTTASRYEQYLGGHYWMTAPSGTAGNAISFTQAMTLDASGRLGIGTTSPATTLDVRGSTSATIRVGSTGNGGAGDEFGNLEFYWADPDAAEVKCKVYAKNVGNVGPGGGGAADLLFATTPAFGSLAERARITSGGYFKASNSGTYIGSAGVYHELVSSNGDYIVQTRNSASSSAYGIRVNYSGSAPNGTGNEFLVCDDTNALRATIRSNGGLANYSANDVNLSDRREKTNFAPAGEYLSKICAIPVQTFNYIDQNLEEDDGLTLGVVAQDVQAVAPELVMESNWGTKEHPKMRLSIYQTDLQYALMKCIQEQQAIIDQLKARLDAANL